MPIEKKVPYIVQCIKSLRYDNEIGLLQTSRMGESKNAPHKYFSRVAQKVTKRYEKVCALVSERESMCD